MLIHEFRTLRIGQSWVSLPNTPAAQPTVLLSGSGGPGAMYLFSFLLSRPLCQSVLRLWCRSGQFGTKNLWWWWWTWRVRGWLNFSSLISIQQFQFKKKEQKTKEICFLVHFFLWASSIHFIFSLCFYRMLILP